MLKDNTIQVIEEVLQYPTSLTSGGHPYLIEDAFNLFLENVPHLFLNGRNILEWVLEEADQVDPESNRGRGLRVLQQIVNTAAVTAPSDLWVMRWVIDCFQQIGLAQTFLDQSSVSLEDFCQDNDLVFERLYHDCEFLVSRKVLASPAAKVYEVDSKKLLQIAKLPSVFQDDVMKVFHRNMKNPDTTLVQPYFSISEVEDTATNWQASVYDLELGFRLVPLVLAHRMLHATSSTDLCDLDHEFFELEGVVGFCQKAGITTQSGSLTVYGERVLSKGPGPFGIIYAYHPYMTSEVELLQKHNDKKVWVTRGENVFASQLANRKTFELANDALDAFTKKYSFHYKLFIEHAVGHGEATRQRYLRNPDLSFIGADLEDDAIDKAVESQAKGELPKNMKFVRNADIGEPSSLLKVVKEATSGPSVMMVGNGFHEVRGQTNEKMVDVFSQYCQANIVLIFTEETGLKNQDLIDTAWNTYHAGFRYVHEISGQGLRPAYDNSGQRYSWSKCAEKGGYVVLEEYTRKTRTIFPYPRKGRNNPSISVSYFCVPKNLLEQLKK